MKPLCFSKALPELRALGDPIIEGTCENERGNGVRHFFDPMKHTLWPAKYGFWKR